MTRCTIGPVVILALGPLVMSLAATAQPLGKVSWIGALAMFPPPI